MSFFGLFSGDKKSSSSNTTTTDNSHREVVSSGGSGSSINGTSNIVNDSSLVQMGIQNNNIASSVLSHINDTNAATIGKLADIVKSTSNDVLQTSVSNGATLQSVAQTAAASNSSGSNFWSKLSSTQQNIIAIGAASLGALYFLKGKK